MWSYKRLYHWNVITLSGFHFGMYYFHFLRWSRRRSSRRRCDCPLKKTSNYCQNDSTRILKTVLTTTTTTVAATTTTTVAATETARTSTTTVTPTWILICNNTTTIKTTIQQQLMDFLSFSVLKDINRYTLNNYRENCQIWLFVFDLCKKLIYWNMCRKIHNYYRFN